MLTTQGPSLGILAIPIPVSPFFQDEKEDEYWEHERYDRVPILGPVTSGGPPVALDPPSDDEVMRALEKTKPVEGGVPCFWERNRNDVRIVKSTRSPTMSIRRACTRSSVRPSSTTPITSARFTSKTFVAWAGRCRTRFATKSPRKSSTSTTTICTWLAMLTPGPGRSSSSRRFTSPAFRLRDKETGRQGDKEN